MLFFFDLDAGGAGGGGGGGGGGSGRAITFKWNGDHQKPHGESTLLDLALF